MGTDIDQFVSSISATDFEQVTHEAHELVSHETAGNSDNAPCSDCGEFHVRRRLVCCVDGTWMLPDGTMGSFHGNASNVFRVWASVKEGRIRASESHDGKEWQQIKLYFKGIGAEEVGIAKLMSGITGVGYELLMAQVYATCCLYSCPSRDEIYLFGFSRGGFIVSAVAGLFHHMGTLDPSAPDFPIRFIEGLGLYRKISTGTKNERHEVYRYLIANTRPSPNIKFVGLVDSVKAVNDEGLFNIKFTDNISHLRHALALIDMRSAFHPMRFLPGSRVRSGRTCLEGWFLGDHSNIGGAKKEDGAALWPLQWILSEAESFGLVLGFKSHPNAPIPDPVDCVRPRGASRTTVTYKNGLKVNVWDLSGRFKQPGLAPETNVQTSDGFSSVDHDINYEYVTDRYIFHDSRGFEANKEEPFKYIIPLDRRLEEVDKDFFRKIKTHNVKLMLVLTHPDKIRATLSQSVVETYAMEHPDNFIQVELDIPPADQPLIRRTIITRYAQEIKQKRDDICSELFGTENQLGLDCDSDCYIVNAQFRRDPASRYDEVLDRSRHVGQDLLRRIDREDRWRDVGNKLEQAVKKATPRVTSARNSFYNPLKLFDDNIDHYTELQERLHAELKVVASVAHLGTLGSLGVIAAVSGLVGWAVGGALVVGNQLTKRLHTTERWRLLISAAVKLILIYDWCAWAPSKTITTELFGRAFIMCVRRAKDIQDFVKKNWDMVDAIFRIDLETTLRKIVTHFRFKPERHILSGLDWCTCSVCSWTG
ncbi:hypothetical protein B0T10DRAFT_585450 [Thelonectria olida]|uniref:T6SS Phospholipase effector Tle1-like catalytic domain-containing protein n=1 Tax=Thelonectria olida TaxID=1576542 RepID=A0A9P9ALS9_9HYPO|nr:hypothetical protein B0T10DRAFT_585450 [Thelonectria olida]